MWITGGMSELRPDRLIALREERGMSQAALARETGIGQSTIVRLEKGGTRNPREVVALARALDCSVEYLLGESDDRGKAKAANDDRLPFLGAEDPSARLLPQGTSKASPMRLVNPDLVEVDQINMAYGLGGTFIDNEQIEVEKVTFSRSWLRAYTHSPPELLFTTDGVGDSMEPTISDHDVIIGDRGQRRLDEVKGDKLWACVFAGVGMVKRLRALPDGTVRIMSDNQLVRDEVATDGDLHIVGRIVAVVKRH